MSSLVMFMFIGLCGQNRTICSKHCLTNQVKNLLLDPTNGWCFQNNEKHFGCRWPWHTPTIINLSVDTWMPWLPDGSCYHPAKMSCCILVLYVVQNSKKLSYHGEKFSLHCDGFLRCFLVHNSLFVHIQKLNNCQLELLLHTLLVK